MYISNCCPITLLSLFSTLQDDYFICHLLLRGLITLPPSLPCSQQNSPHRSQRKIIVTGDLTAKSINNLHLILPQRNVEGQSIPFIKIQSLQFCLGSHSFLSSKILWSFLYLLHCESISFSWIILISIKML